MRQYHIRLTDCNWFLLSPNYQSTERRTRFLICTDFDVIQGEQHRLGRPIRTSSIPVFQDECAEMGTYDVLNASSLPYDEIVRLTDSGLKILCIREKSIGCFDQ